MTNAINNRYLSNILGLGLSNNVKDDISGQIVEEKIK
jgi:hypothetical protein